MNHMGCYIPIFSDTGLEQYESSFLKIYGICDGLLCLSDGHLRLKSTIYLWNPIARRGKKIRDSHLYKTSRGVAYSLAFGYHDDDYKVIKIARYRDRYVVCIYSLSKDAWDFLTLNLLDNIHYGEDYDKYMHYPNAMLVNGVAYFLKEEPYQVVCFDIVYERIQVVDLPKHFKADTSFVMKSYGDSLALLEYCESGLVSTELVMWTLSGMLMWEKRFCIDTENSYPLGFIDDGKIILRTCDSYEFRLFNLVTNQFTELKFRQGFETLEERRALWGIDSFAESLVLVDNSTKDEYIRIERCSAHTTAFTLQKWKE
ncbi:F-box/kelch-repeat protein At3g23880-like [Apium graveolens]|uniref:F-box/kelch-repeat protein At3g23880-like n=1 Tax=Apium graveolens TaxID=4045 RepID=UPI003D7A7953